MTGKWLSVSVLSLIALFCAKLSFGDETFSEPSRKVDTAVLDWSNSVTVNGADVPAWLSSSSFSDKRAEALGRLAQEMIKADKTLPITLDCDPSPCVTDNLAASVDNSTTPPQLRILMKNKRNKDQQHFFTTTFVLEFPPKDSEPKKMKFLKREYAFCQDGDSGSCKVFECDTPGCRAEKGPGQVVDLEQSGKKDLNKLAEKTLGTPTQQPIEELMPLNPSDSDGKGKLSE